MEQNKTNLAKLQSKCDAVNKRYSAGLNDDDAVRAMFNFEKKVINEATIVIGYDDYQAISKSELIEKFKNVEKENIKQNEGYVWVKFYKNHRSYRGRLTESEYNELKAETAQDR